MPNLKGGTLFQRITQNNVICEKSSKLIMQKFLNALAYMHERRIVHRDLKLENLVFRECDDEESITIIDLGIAE